MRDQGYAPIWDAWLAGGPFVGEAAAPHSRVTVEKDWFLNLQTRAGAYPKCPIRWYQRIDNSQIETEVPNIKSVDWDRSLDQDAASCTIQIYNTEMLANSMAGSSRPVLGQPGAFTWRLGNSQAVARWGPPPGAEWANVITPDALIRTYQGYGGNSKSIPEAVADGNLALTGVWLVDTVRVKTDGMIEVKARDMAKLLIEQHLYPPLVPSSIYPHGLRYCRFVWTLEDRTTTSTALVAEAGQKRAVYQQVGVSAASGSDLWSTGFDGRMAGHYPHEVFDGNLDTYWVSTGNDAPWEPFAVEWIEAASGDWIDTVRIFPRGGPYMAYISVMENGNWVDPGNGLIPYAPLTVGRYTGPNTANLPFVARFGVNPDQSIDVKLPRAYRADKVRFTFTGLPNSGIGIYPYRAMIRELRLILSSPLTDTQTSTTQELVQHDGNYKDYAEIIKDLALWSGFTAYDGTNGDPEVFGNIESTGIADTGSCITEDQFDKKPVIDAMHIIRDIVGYWIWVDEEGGFHFESPNWWKNGNFRLDGTATSFVPEVDEEAQMTEYTLEYSDKALRSQIIIASDEPTLGFADTVTTYFDPGEAADALRGIVKPMMLINKALTDKREQEIMANLIAIHILAATYTGSVDMAANPCISLNDQIRLREEITAETGIHYVRGISCRHDLDEGPFTMTLSTHRLGDDAGFTVTTQGVITGTKAGTTKTPPPSGMVDRDLSVGMTGTDVLAWQHSLNVLMTAGLTENGTFGSETQTATNTFKTAHSLPANGIVDAVTKGIMNQLLAEALE